MVQIYLLVIRPFRNSETITYDSETVLMYLLLKKFQISSFEFLFVIVGVAIEHQLYLWRLGNFSTTILLMWYMARLVCVLTRKCYHYHLLTTRVLLLKIIFWEIRIPVQKTVGKSSLVELHFVQITCLQLNPLTTNVSLTHIGTSQLICRANELVNMNFSPVSHFYTPWKRKETYGLLTFSGGIEM